MVIKIFIKNEGDFKSNTNILQRQFFFLSSHFYINLMAFIPQNIFFFFWGGGIHKQRILNKSKEKFDKINCSFFTLLKFELQVQIPVTTSTSSRSTARPS